MTEDEFREVFRSRLSGIDGGKAIWSDCEANLLDIWKGVAQLNEQRQMFDFIRGGTGTTYLEIADDAKNSVVSVFGRFGVVERRNPIAPPMYAWVHEQVINQLNLIKLFDKSFDATIVWEKSRNPRQPRYYGTLLGDDGRIVVRDVLVVLKKASTRLP